MNNKKTLKTDGIPQNEYNRKILNVIYERVPKAESKVYKVNSYVRILIRNPK